MIFLYILFISIGSRDPILMCHGNEIVIIVVGVVVSCFC